MNYEAIEFLELTAEDFELTLEEASWFVGKSINVLQKKLTKDQFLELARDKFQFNEIEINEIVKRLDHASTLAQVVEIQSLAEPKKALPASQPRPLLEKIITPQTIAQRQSTIVEKIVPEQSAAPVQSPVSAPAPRKSDPYREPIG